MSKRSHGRDHMCDVAGDDTIAAIANYPLIAAANDGFAGVSSEGLGIELAVHLLQMR